MKSATTNSVGKSNNTLRHRITVPPRRNVWMQQRSATVVRTSAIIRTLAYRWLASVTVWKKSATSKSGTPNPNHKLVRAEVCMVRSGLTTQAQRPGPQDVWIANRDAMPGSLQRMVRPQQFVSDLSQARICSVCRRSRWPLRGAREARSPRRKCLCRSLTRATGLSS